MASFKKLIIVVFLISSVFFYCSDAATTKTYTLLIIGGGGNFTGYYSLFNNGKSKTKGLTGIQGTGNEVSLYQYEEDIDELDTIDILINRIDVGTSLSIKLFRYDQEVADEYLAGEDSGTTTSVTMSLRLKYESTSDQTDTTTDTTSTTTAK